jgi:pyruvate/2-oxoglutarate dehydrogenase complex dihydrolipoamide acyltransferase (E2) component
MIYKLQVPGPIADVEEIRILEWHGAAGTLYAENDLVVELETYKAVIEVRAGQAAYLRAVLCEAGDWRRIGETLALLSDSVDEPLPTTTNADDLSALTVAFAIV